jgi:hypothetical protein
VIAQYGEFGCCRAGHNLIKRRVKRSFSEVTIIKRKRVTGILRPVAPHIAMLLAVLGSEHMKILIWCAQWVERGVGGWQRMPSDMPTNYISGFPLARRWLQVSGSWPGNCVLCARGIYRWKGNCWLGKGGRWSSPWKMWNGLQMGFALSTAEVGRPLLRLWHRMFWMSQLTAVVSLLASWANIWLSFLLSSLKFRSVLYGTVPVRTPYKAIAWLSVWSGSGNVHTVYVCQIALLDVSWGLERHSGGTAFMHIDGLWLT